MALNETDIDNKKLMLDFASQTQRQHSILQNFLGLVL